MTQRKGLSQILYLIIAASVLMMAALSLIFMFNDSVSGGQTDAAGCNTAIQNQCDITGQEKVSVPTNCVNPNTEEVIDGIRYSKEGSKDGYSAEMDCSSG